MSCLAELSQFLAINISFWNKYVITPKAMPNLLQATFDQLFFSLRKSQSYIFYR